MWDRRVLALAQYPNTYMKVPGFNELGLDRARPFSLPLPIDKLPPLIDLAVDAFGARRLTWGSNFPHVAEKEGYRNCLQLLMEHVKFKSEEDKEWLCGRTAATLFRFGGPLPGLTTALEQTPPDGG